eukprot:589495-Amphidinium_carterae.1
MAGPLSPSQLLPQCALREILCNVVFTQQALGQMLSGNKATVGVASISVGLGTLFCGETTIHQPSSHSELLRVTSRGQYAHQYMTK